MFANNLQEASPTSPGIYDISSETYHGGAGISRTKLCEFVRSPYHYWHRYVRHDREPIKPTAAMEFGSAFHLLILEPHLFHEKVAVAPEGLDRRRTADKAIWAQFEAESIGKILIKGEDYQHMQNMANSLWDNAAARALIEGGQYERSIYYIEKNSGTLCKTRPDILRNNFIADLKTADDASFHEFQKDMVKYGYHLQAGMCFDAAEEVLKTKLAEFVFIPVEKTPPYAVAIYPIDIESINVGRRTYQTKLMQLNECHANNVWPSYESRIITLPGWVQNQY